MSISPPYIRTLAAAADVVDNTLGPAFLDRPSINWEQVWKESDTKLPIICILAKGSDPTKAIEDLAKTKKVNVLGVSMGQGQEIIARKYLTKAMQSGLFEHTMPHYMHSSSLFSSCLDSNSRGLTIGFLQETGCFSKTLTWVSAISAR